MQQPLRGDSYLPPCFWPCGLTIDQTTCYVWNQHFVCIYSAMADSNLVWKIFLKEIAGGGGGGGLDILHPPAQWPLFKWGLNCCCFMALKMLCSLIVYLSYNVLSDTLIWGQVTSSRHWVLILTSTLYASCIRYACQATTPFPKRGSFLTWVINIDKVVETSTQ